jgi:HK97 family phage major capsid protein
MPLTLNGVAAAVPKAVAGPIFEKATQSSIVMQLAQKAPSTLTGTAIPVTVGRITADWVAEGQEKHVSPADATTLLMDPKKVATIILASQEFVTADPGGLYKVIKDQAAEALGIAFDWASLHGLNYAGNPGPFATYINKGLTKEIELGTATPEEGGIDGDLTKGQELVPRFNGYALDTSIRAQLANVRDTTGRRMIDDPAVIGGLPAKYSDFIKELLTGTVSGWGGDWRQCAWGVGMDLTMKLSDQTTVRVAGNLVPVWQTNQVAVLLEASYGFVVNNGPANFVRYLTPTVGTTARARSPRSGETTPVPETTPVQHSRAK